VTDRKVNDIGGLEAGPIDRAEHAQTLFEKRVDALMMLMTNPRIGAFKVDAMRRSIETCTPEEYASLGYYQKWLRALAQLLVEQQVLDADELAARVAAVKARGGGYA